MSLRQEIDVAEAGGKLLGLGYATCGGITPRPGPQPLILAVLRQLADGAEHASVDIRDNLAAQFELTAEELARKQGGDSTRFVNHVAWPLAWLNQAKAIVRVRKGTYRITVYGIAILEECKHTQEITLKELRAFLSEQPATAFHGKAACMTSSFSGGV
jgi:restriction endonuclease Mrr